MQAKADTALSGRFTVVDATGELVDADSLPTGQLITNGVNDVATITVTNIGTGDYRWQMTSPNDLTEGDHIEIVISATIDSISTAGRVYSATIVDRFPSEDVDANLVTWKGSAPADLTDTDKVPASVQHKGSVGLTSQEKADVNTEADTALADYNPPTKAELDTAESNIVNAVQAVNTGAARYISIQTNAAYELPDSGAVAYPIEIRTFDGDGEPVAIDSAADPTVTVTRTTDSTDLSGNLSAISNPATGVYRMTLTITEGSDVVAPLRIDASGAINSTSRSTSAYPVVTDAVSVDFTSADRTKLDELHTQMADVPKLGTSYRWTNDNSGSGFDDVTIDDVP